MDREIRLSSEGAGRDSMDSVETLTSTMTCKEEFVGSESPSTKERRAQSKWRMEQWRAVGMVARDSLRITKLPKSSSASTDSGDSFSDKIVKKTSVGNAAKEEAKDGKSSMYGVM